MAHILIVDDDPRICLFLSRLIKQMGHESTVAHSMKDGAALGGKGAFDLVLLDLELPDGNGLHILPELMKGPLEPEVIIITGTGNARGAETAFKYGAWDYVQKPFLLEEVSLPITRALQYHMEKQSVPAPVPLVRPHIIGESDAILRCLEAVARAAATDASVLIAGETGTGKELFARAIHENSRRSEGPFIAVDCGALPETLVESTLFGHEKGAFTGADKKQGGLIMQADGGTLMLDEVGDLPMAVQKSFLRTLQERRVRPVGGTSEKLVDFRLVAATHLDLDQMVQENRFRQDLLFRIRAIGITLPPLRERTSDIEEIVIRKTHILARRYGLDAKAVSPEFLKTLMAHSWPGNVRELINVLEHALAGAGQDPTLFPKHLPAAYRMAGLDFEPASPPASAGDITAVLGEEGNLPLFNEFRNRLEKAYLTALIKKANGDRTLACQVSGISQSRLYGLLKKHHLPGFGSQPD